MSSKTIHNTYTKRDDFIVINKIPYVYNIHTKEWEYYHNKISNCPRNLTNLNIINKYKQNITRYITFIDNNLLYDKQTKKLREIEKNDYIIYKNDIHLDYINSNKYINCGVFKNLKNLFNDDSDMVLFIKYMYMLITRSVEKNENHILFLDIGGIFIKNIYITGFNDMYSTQWNRIPLDESLFKLHIIKISNNYKQYDTIIKEIYNIERKYPIIIFNNTNTSVTSSHNAYYQCIKDNNIDVITFTKKNKPLDPQFTLEHIKKCIYNKAINRFAKIKPQIEIITPQMQSYTDKYNIM